MAEVHSIEIKVDSTQAQTASRNLDKMSGSANGAESALKNLTRAAVGLVALDKLKDAGMAAIKAADSYTEMSGKLRLATGSQEQFNKAQEALFKIAQSNSTALGDTVQLYSRLATGMKDMGRSQAETLKVTDAVAKSLRISSASASEASSVITQFSQAIGSGVLRGEEFNSVMENGNRLARALADGIGVPIKELRSLAEQGKLTGDIVVKAILSQTASLDAEAEMMQTTVSQAWTQLENAATQYIGEADQANGTTKELSQAIVLLAQNFEELADPIANAISTLAKVEIGGWLALSDAIKTASIALQEMVGIQQAGTADPETLKLMKMGQGQMSLAEIAGKPADGATKQIEKSAKAAGIHLANTGKAAKKAADEAQAAFEATINANVKAAEDAAKLYEAQSRTQISRLDLELEKAEELARVETKKAQSQEEKIKIAEQLQAKTVEIINAELALRQAVIDKEAEGTSIKIKGVEDELASADKLKLNQAERIKLQAELNSLQTEQSLRSEERTQAELDAQKQIQDASKAVTDARLEGETSVREEALRTLEVLSSNLEYSREMATGLAEAFGEIGSSIGEMTIALAQYEKQQATIEIARKEAIDKAKGDQKKIDEINQDSAAKQAKAQIKLYGDMTQAAQGFFKKGTKGYEAMGAAVKVFRAFEMAQSAMSFMDQMTKQDGLFSSFKEVLTQMGILSAQQTQQQITEATQKGMADATAGAAHQGTAGDPYTAFARVAAWVALMAGLGLMIGGGGGGGSASAPKPPEPGTGTVFGDPMAVSESISKSIGILEENSSNDLNYSADMLDALYQIRDALGGIENLVAADLTPAITNLMTKYGDGLKQAGFIFRDQQLSKVMASGKYEGYIGARIETESSQMMITVKKGQTMVAEYGDKFAKEFFKIIETMRTGIDEVGKVIGISETEIVDRLKGFKIKGQQVDIAGLSAEEAAKKLEAAFSAMSDTMAMRALPEFKDFRQSGEGYFETVVRVSEGISRAKGSLELLGMEAIKYTDIIEKDKDVAAEITRQTIMAQGDLSEGTRKYVKQLEGSASDIIESYGQILNITNLMRGAGFGTAGLNRDMVNAAGGLSAFEEALTSFRDNFMSDEQRLSADTADLTKQFAKLGFTLPKTKDEFYKIATALSNAGEGGAKAFAKFITLNEPFADLMDRISESVSNAYDELKSIQDRFVSLGNSLRSYLDELTGAKSTFGSPESRYMAARAEFSRVAALARQGDETALGALSGVGKTFLDASRQYNASSEQFQNDLASVTAAVKDSIAYTESQVSTIDAQLKAAEASHSELVKISSSSQSTADGIANLNAILTGTSVQHFASGGYASPGFAVVGENGPELVSFGSAGYVSNAGSSRSLFDGVKDVIEKGDNEQVAELQALVRLQSAANQELIKEMRGMKIELSELSRKAKIEAAA